MCYNSCLLCQYFCFFLFDLGISTEPFEDLKEILPQLGEHPKPALPAQLPLSPLLPLTLPVRTQIVEPQGADLSAQEIEILRNRQAAQQASLQASQPVKTSSPEPCPEEPILKPSAPEPTTVPSSFMKLIKIQHGIKGFAHLRQYLFVSFLNSSCLIKLSSRFISFSILVCLLSILRLNESDSYGRFSKESEKNLRCSRPTGSTSNRATTQGSASVIYLILVKTSTNLPSWSTR